MEVKGKLDNGFAYTVDNSVLDDMEMVDALADAMSTNPLAISMVVKKLLGDDQRKVLYDTVRREDGTVPVEEVTNSVVAIFEQMGDQGKN